VLCIREIKKAYDTPWARPMHQSTYGTFVPSINVNYAILSHIHTSNYRGGHLMRLS
jgi:hypothetical protein